jgi:hypothetical protein
MPKRRDGRAVDGTRLESAQSGNALAGSNPALSATITDDELKNVAAFLQVLLDWQQANKASKV